MINKFFLTLLFISFFAAFSPYISAQETEKDSITTPFKKGRWLTGLSGSIGSATTENTSSNEETTSNHYRIEISSGKFIIDRLNIGLAINLERENIQNDSDEDRTVENLFIGPKATYFLSKSEIGSLYFGLTPGFILYRDETSIMNNDILTDVVDLGSGFGMFATFGYVYVIHDRIAFDVGMNWSNYWINIDQESSDVDEINNVNFRISDLTFSFGFKILLDSQSH